MAIFSRSAALLAATVLLASPALAEPAGPPNIEGTQLPPPGQGTFNFTHRLQVGPGPMYPVSAVPSFNLEGGVTDWLGAGLLYSTKTFTVPNASQEFEASLKQRLLEESKGAPVGLSLKEAFNVTALSPDGELEVTRDIGPIGLTGLVRGFGNFQYSGHPGYAAGGGAAVKLFGPFQAVGDAIYAPPTAAGNPSVAWGAGLRIEIPNSPHVLTLEASNAGTQTLQGASIATSDIRYGFTFVVPFQPSGWVPAQAAALPPVSAASGTPGVSDPMVAAAIAHGRTLFAANCAACHGADGRGGFGPDLHGVAAKKGSDYVSLRILNGSAKGMPPFRGRLTADEVAALTAFVKHL